MRSRRFLTADANLPQWRLIVVFVTTAFVQEAAPLDTSLALVWSTEWTDDNRGTIFILYGDPNSYRDQIQRNETLNGTSLAVYVADASAFNYIPVETHFAQSQLYYSQGDEYLSYADVNVSGTSYDLYNLLVPAVSNLVTGLSVDWVSNLIYWSDAIYQRICVVETKIQLFWRPVVESGLLAPQDVAVYPQQGILFWTDSSPKIERLDLANNTRHVLVTNDSLLRPTTLVIDFVTQRLLWLDSAASRIGFVNFDGSGLSFWSMELFSGISSFIIFKEYFFLGDKTQPQIYAYNFTERTFIGCLRAKDTSGVIDMTAYGLERQPSFTSPCIMNNGECDHFCITKSSTESVCQCAMGFFLDSNGATCTPALLEDNFLLVSDQNQFNIFQVDTANGEVRATSDVYSKITAMDYDPDSKTVYGFDSDNYLIRKVTLDGHATSVILQFQGIIEITSLAVDTLTRNLYYADHGAKTIGYISLSTKINRTLLSQAVSSPRALVLDISNRLMYWSDCGHLTIERGSIANPTINQMSIITGLLDCVPDFAIDFQNQVIYWGYEFGRIESSKLDGTSRTTIHEDGPATCSGLALDSRYLYIADSTKRQIQKLDRNTKQVTNLTKILFTKPYALLYYANYSPSTTATLTTTSSISETATAWNSYFTTIEFGSTTPPGPSLTVILPAAICSSVAFIAVTVTLGVIFGLRYKKKRAGNTGRTMKPDETEMSDNHGYQALCAAGLASTEQRVLPASGLAGNAYSSSSPSYMYDNNRSQTMSRSDKCISLYPDTYDVLVDPDLAKPPLPPPRPSEINPGDSDDYLNASDLHPSSKDHTDIYSTYIE